MPVTTEKRPRGKTATLISNVRGDKGELIQMLKQALGCGGRAVAHDTVEIQGDHADAIQGLLLRHVGVGAMRGVAGLKPPKPDPAELAAELHETARREARAKSEEALAAERRRRLEQRQRAIREAVPAKHENTREFHAFASMMKRWRYWDQDYARLHEMHHRHLRQLDEADARRAGAGFLDADLDDNDAMQTGPKSAVLDAMRRDLDALNGARAADAEHEDARAALDALGMIASPSPFRQTREERFAESKRNAAVARARAAAEAKRSKAMKSAAATRSAAADDRYAAGGAGASRAWSRPPVGGGSTSTCDIDVGVGVDFVRRGGVAFAIARLLARRARLAGMRDGRGFRARRRARQGRRVEAVAGIHRREKTSRRRRIRVRSRRRGRLPRRLVRRRRRRRRFIRRGSARGRGGERDARSRPRRVFVVRARMDARRERRFLVRTHLGRVDVPAPRPIRGDERDETRTTRGRRTLG